MKSSPTLTKFQEACESERNEIANLKFLYACKIQIIKIIDLTFILWQCLECIQFWALIRAVFDYLQYIYRIYRFSMCLVPI